MDFERDETVRAVAELAADVLRNEAAGSLDAEFDEHAWAALAKVGLTALAVPADLGGDGLGAAEVAAVLTEVGRRGVTVPALATLALGVLPVAAHGTPEQCAALLPDVVAGTALLTAAVSEPGDPRCLPGCVAEPGWRLTGVKSAVPYAAQARGILVPARTPDGSGVFVVAPDADGVTLDRTPTSSGAPEYTVRLDGAPGELLGTDATGGSVAALRSYALLGAVAEGSGALAGALDLTTEHVRTRHQFGKPLAAFQAVAQEIADIYIAARTVQLAATSACWRLTTGRDADGELALAAYWFAEEALPALRTCHHLHGGLGVDVTYPLHRHYATVKDLTRMLGGPGQRLAELEA